MFRFQDCWFDYHYGHKTICEKRRSLLNVVVTWFVPLGLLTELVRIIPFDAVEVPPYSTFVLTWLPEPSVESIQLSPSPFWIFSVAIYKNDYFTPTLWKSQGANCMYPNKDQFLACWSPTKLDNINLPDRHTRYKFFPSLYRIVILFNLDNCIVPHTNQRLKT